MQVRVQNLSELDFQLADARLADTADGPDLRLVPLNTEPRQVRPRASASPGKEREARGRAGLSLSCGDRDVAVPSA